MESASTSPPINDQFKQYLETKLKLLKYQGIDKASDIVAEILTDLIVVVLTLLTFFFFTVTLALFAGNLLGSYWEGFGCVTILYAVILFTAKAIKISLQNIFIRIFIRKIFKSS